MSSIARCPRYQNHGHSIGFGMNSQLENTTALKNISQLRRANNPFRRLSSRACCLLRYILKQLESSPDGITFISVQTLCEVSGVCRRQNINLLHEIAHVVHYDYNRLVVIESDECTYGYTFSYAIDFNSDDKKQQEKDREKDREIDGEILKTPLSIYNTYGTTITLNNELKSKDIDIEYRLGKNEVTKPIKSVKKPKQRTKTPKDLHFFYPLSREDCDFLQRESKREFSLDAMNQILLSVSKRRPDLHFRDKEKFLKYATKLFANEKRKTTETNKLTFRIKDTIPAEELEMMRKEKFLRQFEENTTALNDEGRLKRSIASRFPRDIAYEFLMAYRGSRIKDNGVFEIDIAKNVKLTTLQQDILFNEVRSIYDKIHASTGKYEGILAIHIINSTNGNIITSTTNESNQVKNLKTKDDRLSALQQMIFESFKADKAYKLTSNIYFKELDPEKVLLYLNEGLQLLEGDKNVLRQCIKKIWGESVVITAKRQMTEDVAVYVDTGQDNSPKSRGSLWSQIAAALKNCVGESSFNAWFKSPLIKEIKEDGEMIKMYVSDFWGGYVHSNYGHTISDILPNVKGKIMFVQDNGETKLYSYEDKFMVSGKLETAKTEIIGEHSETV